MSIVPHIMQAPADIASGVLSNLSFADLRALHEQVLHIGQARGRSREAVEAMWRARMAELTALRRFEVGASGPRLTPEELQWLSDAGVRTLLKSEWRTPSKKWYIVDRNLRARVFVSGGAHTSRDCWVNGAPVLRVNACGEFWAAPYVHTHAMLYAGPIDVTRCSPLDEEVGEDLGMYVHRVGGPAVRDGSGFEMWARFGVLHRTDGPALVIPGVPAINKWFFRGAPARNKAHLDALAARAPPNPTFDDADAAVAAALPEGVAIDAEGLAALTDPGPRPLPALAPLAELPFAPNAQLEQLLASDELVERVQVDARYFRLDVPIAPAKPLGDALREDLLAALSRPANGSEMYRNYWGGMGERRDLWNFVKFGGAGYRVADLLGPNAQITGAGNADGGGIVLAVA